MTSSECHEASLIPLVDFCSEQRFQAIQEQLNSIQQTLQQISKGSPATTPPALAASSPTPARQTVPPFEGQSSFHHETLVARDAALSAVVAARGGELNDQVSSALSSLKDSLDTHTPGPAQGSSETSRTREPLLPVDLVVAVVKKVKGRCTIRVWNSADTPSATPVFPRQSIVERHPATGIAVPVDLFPN